MLGRHMLNPDMAIIRRLGDMSDWWDDWKDHAVNEYGGYPTGTSWSMVYAGRLRPLMLSKFQQEYASTLDRINRYVDQANQVPDDALRTAMNKEAASLKASVENWSTLARDIVQDGNGSYRVTDHQLRLDIGDFHVVRQTVENFYLKYAPVFAAIPKVNVDAEAAADAVRRTMTPEVIRALEEEAGGYFRNDGYFALVKQQYFLSELLKQYNKQITTDTTNAITVQIQQNQTMLDRAKPIIAKAGTVVTKAVHAIEDKVKNVIKKAKDKLIWTLIIGGGITIGSISLLIYGVKRMSARASSKAQPRRR